MANRVLMAIIGFVAILSCLLVQAAAVSAPIISWTQIAPSITVAIGTIPQLTWSSNKPVPTINGHIVPPPQPLKKYVPNPHSTPINTSVHWYQGSIYEQLSSSPKAYMISTTIQIPSDLAPSPNEFYYVIMSGWDSNFSYDQLGFTNNYGSWGLAYSWTSGPIANPTYHYSPEAFVLTPGATYTFDISAYLGNTIFTAYQEVAPGNLQEVWAQVAPSGGNYLYIDNGFNGYYGYTNYEEIWQVSDLAPPYNFYFYNNYWKALAGSEVSTIWSPINSGVAGVATTISGNSVLISNLPLKVAPPPAPKTTAS